MIVSNVAVKINVIKKAIELIDLDIERHKQIIYSDYEQHIEKLNNNFFYTLFFKPENDRTVNKFKAPYTAYLELQDNFNKLKSICDISSKDYIMLNLSDAYLIAKYYNGENDNGTN